MNSIGLVFGSVRAILRRLFTLVSLAGCPSLRRRRPYLGGSVLWVTSLLVAPQTNAGFLYVDGWAYCTNPLNPCPTYSVNQTYNSDTYPGPGVPEVYVENGHQGVLDHAYARADYGVLKVSGHAEATGGTSTYYNLAITQSTARWVDSIVVNSPGLPSYTDAVMTATFAVGGGFFRGGDPGTNPGAFDHLTAATQATWDVNLFNDYFNASYDATRYYSGYESVQTYVNGTPAASIFDVYTVDVPIQLGNMFDIRMTLYGGAYALTGGAEVSAWADYDLGQSAYWGGISAVTVGGEAVPFTLTAQSGHDWTQSSIPSAVPVPAALWLFASAVAGMAGFLRRRRPTDAPA